MQECNSSSLLIFYINTYILQVQFSQTHSMKLCMGQVVEEPVSSTFDDLSTLLTRATMHGTHHSVMDKTLAALCTINDGESHLSAGR